MPSKHVHLQGFQIAILCLIKGNFQVSAQAEKVRRARLGGNKEYVECESQQENDPATPFEEVRKTVTLKDLQNKADKNRKNRVVDTKALVEEMKRVDGKIIAL